MYILNPELKILNPESWNKLQCGGYKLQVARCRVQGLPLKPATCNSLSFLIVSCTIWLLLLQHM